MDILRKLKEMSQWVWFTEIDLKRNNIAREAYQEIEELRAQAGVRRLIRERKL